MDTFSVHLGSCGRCRLEINIFNVLVISVYKHILNPLQPKGSASPFCIVTALVDQIDFTGNLSPDFDIRMSGHVIFVGRSSAETSLQLEQFIEGQWVKFTEATFVMVARDPLNRSAAFINPLEVVTEEEKEILKKAELNNRRCEDRMVS